MAALVGQASHRIRVNEGRAPNEEVGRRQALRLDQDERSPGRRVGGAGRLVVHHFEHCPAQGLVEPVTGARVGDIEVRARAVVNAAGVWVDEIRGLDEGELFNMYREVPSITDKAAWALKHTRNLDDPDFKTGTPQADQAFLRDLVAFYVIESRSAAPLVKLSIFKIRSIATANVVMLLVASAMFGMFFFASLYVQEILGYSPLQAGLAFLPVSAGIIVGAGIAQQVIPGAYLSYPEALGSVPSPWASRRRSPGASRPRRSARGVEVPSFTFASSMRSRIVAGSTASPGRTNAHSRLRANSTTGPLLPPDAT